MLLEDSRKLPADSAISAAVEDSYCYQGIEVSSCWHYDKTGYKGNLD